MLAEQPLPGFVTVKVYEPAAFTVGEEVVPPDTIPGPAQLNVAPAVAEEPFKTALVTEHVRVCEFPALASGAPAAAVTFTRSEEVQPLLVTTNVYVPAADVEGVAEEELKPPGPDQL